MSLGIVLDVMIGLAFTYLLLSILVSGLQEVIAGAMSLRGTKLRKGLIALLSNVDPKEGSALFNQVFDHPLITNLSKNKLPSYVPSRNFSMALVEALKNGTVTPGGLMGQIESTVGALPDGAAKKSLMAFLTQADGDLQLFQKRVETWFDDGMDRVSGVYKRHAQIVMLFLGLGIAILLNVDSIMLARTLWTDPTTRDAMVKAAEQKIGGATQGGDIKMTMEQARCEFETLPLPIGWRDSSDTRKADCLAGKRGKGASIKMATALLWDKITSSDALWAVLGWLITAGAVSFGAPFWFAALQQLFKIRNAGPKPPKSGEGGGTTS